MLVLIIINVRSQNMWRDSWSARKDEFIAVLSLK